MKCVGDYSHAQLLRVNRQAIVLRKYYELLMQAIRSYRENGTHYLVTALGTQAGKILGDEVVAVSTVRYWHSQYVTNDGKFRPDERGHHTRELLILEEDVKQKFTKWSLLQAKSDDLCVEAARNFLNQELLVTLAASMPPMCTCLACFPFASLRHVLVDMLRAHGLQVGVLSDYKIKLPVSMSTTWRWMQAISIYRDKYTQSYYNDKHQDATVLVDRARYIQVMDVLSLRQPLWLQFPLHEFDVIKERMPEDNFLVHHYYVDGAHMVEVHVDLDDSFDPIRAALPLGGHFSVRFPDGMPSDAVLRHSPPGLPPPGAGLTPLSSAAAAEVSSTTAGNENERPTTPERPDAASLPTVAMINKMKVLELKTHLLKLGLDATGLKTVLLDRLRAAVSQARADAAAQASGDESDSDEQEWAVRKILSRRVCTQIADEIAFDVTEYQVEWDYPDEEDPSQFELTWENESNLTHAVEALHEFFASQPKQPGCEFGHIVGVCRCSRPIIHAGQDESIFKAFQKSSFQWVVQGVRGLRKKTDGPGEMVSGFKDELRGFGHPLSNEELSLVNAFRKARGRSPLQTSPAVRFLSYGKNKDGYWTYDHFAEQVCDVLDMYEALYPNAQVLVEVDWSSGHSKHREDGLNVSAMSVNMGGKQLIPHASKMTADCLGDNAVLQEGELQFFYFRSAEERRDAGATDGKPDPPPFYKPNLAPGEYVGLAKGKKQVLYERGLWTAGMVERIDEDDPKGRDQTLSMDHVLSNCPDFRNETGALQTLIEARGHILVMSPKGHCELAGELD